MSGIEIPIFNCATRVKITFADDIGNTETPCGSGFWISKNNETFFVTNRHNVDATLKRGNDTKLICTKIGIQLRKFFVNGDLPETKFFEVKNLNECLKTHSTADVAILVNPSFTEDTSEYRYSIIKNDDLATADFFNVHAKPFDIASFIGFPGIKEFPLWDSLWSLPVGRIVNIASIPNISFTNPKIPTSDIVLVSGLSFSGSSGSPVMLHTKGLTGVITTTNYTPSKLIGIMSGHMWNEKNTNDPYEHSGLSYFTRSTSIIELMDSIQ
jgi:hypothetical protein